MTTYSIRELKAQASAILRSLDNGDEVIITRRGKPCGKLIPVPPPAEPKPQRRSLLGIYADRPDLPDFTYQDFQDIKTIWEPRPLPADTHPFRAPPPAEPYPSLAHLQSIFANLPDLDYADFQEAKKIWEPRPFPPEDADAE